MLKQLLLLLLASILAVLLQHQLAWVLSGVHHVYAFFHKSIGSVTNNKAWVVTTIKIINYTLIPFFIGWLINILYHVIAGKKTRWLYPIIWILWIIFTITLTATS